MTLLLWAISYNMGYCYGLQAMTYGLQANATGNGLQAFPLAVTKSRKKHNTR